MYCDHIGWRLTNYTSTDVVLNSFFANSHHGNRGTGGQPVGFVVSAGIVAHAVEVTEQKWHGTEATQTGSSKTCIFQ